MTIKTSFAPETKPEQFKSVKTSHSYVIPTLKTPEILKAIDADYSATSVKFRGLYRRWNYIWSDQAYLDGTNV
jgi:hypothetical protein